MNRIDKASRANPLAYTIGYLIALVLGIIISGYLSGVGPISFIACVQLHWIYLIHSGARDLLDIGRPPTSGISYPYILAGCLLIAGFLTSIAAPDDLPWPAVVSGFIGFGLIASFFSLRAAATDLVAAEARFTQDRHAEITTAMWMFFAPFGFWLLHPRLRRLAAAGGATG